MPLDDNRHADDETLEKYSLGTLAESETAALEQHLLICSACRERLAETDAYVQGMQAAARRLRDAGNNPNSS